MEGGALMLTVCTSSGGECWTATSHWGGGVGVAVGFGVGEEADLGSGPGAEAIEIM